MAKDGIITLAKAKALVKIADKAAAKHRRAQAAAKREADKVRAAAEKKERARWIAEDSSRMAEEIAKAAGQGIKSAVRCMGSDPTFRRERQAALIKTLVRKGFKAEEWSQYIPEERGDPDWPGHDSYSLLGVKASW